MSNTDRANGFIVQNKDKIFSPFDKNCEASYAGTISDECYLNSAGRITATAGVIAGIVASKPKDVSAGGWVPVATADVDDKIEVYTDLNVVFTGQIASGALADPYTTRASSACYDGAGSSGARYVDNAASSNDVFKSLHPFIEPDTGNESAVGAYQKQYFCFNSDKHFMGDVE